MSRTPNTRGQLALTIAKDLRGKLAVGAACRELAQIR